VPSVGRNVEATYSGRILYKAVSILSGCCVSTPSDCLLLLAVGGYDSPFPGCLPTMAPIAGHKRIRYILLVHRQVGFRVAPYSSRLPNRPL
jgi:hypothetical protein